jgi:hypothetical protein
MEAALTASTLPGAEGFHAKEPNMNMQSAQVEDYEGCDDIAAHDLIADGLIECPECASPSMTLFRNPAGLLAISLSGLVFYSALAYGLWRIFHS